ncbi:hypothetical protein ACIOHC_11180 [Streptomyces sp. NPDC088252]|uniref:hypothetical protein n=1 Tax=unclassified Streptomyces TaxID=2593676 RepID=UPI00381CF5E3
MHTPVHLTADCYPLSMRCLITKHTLKVSLGRSQTLATFTDALAITSYPFSNQKTCNGENGNRGRNTNGKENFLLIGYVPLIKRAPRSAHTHHKGE